MGAIWEQQGCLKISANQGLINKEKLKVGKIYEFQKDGHRLFMLDVPLDLVTDKWQAIARVTITEFTAGHGTTKGFYKVLKIYSDEETRIVSATFIPYKNLQKY